MMRPGLACCALIAIAIGGVARAQESAALPEWPSPPSAPAKAPNVLVVMTDDVGFGASSAFGGPIPTPTAESIASNGLKYNQFHTAAICSPTRAALLTGRNPHSVGMGIVSNAPNPNPGYNTVIPSSAGTIAEILKQNGYNTALFGKAHITPEWEQSQAGPFDRWPTGLGFEHFYGFLGADTSEWEPALYENTTPVEPPRDDPDYYFEKDMTDRALAWMRAQNAAAPNKPFFLYYAPGAAHAPNHVPKAWLERFRGKFARGWDIIRAETFARQKAMNVIPKNAELAPRPANIPAWASLSADQKQVYARMMEAYAAQIAYSDDQTKRLLDELRAQSELDNTLVIFIVGDNGATPEGLANGFLFEQMWSNGFKQDLAELKAHVDDIGGVNSFPLYPAGWAWAMNTPFQYHKFIVSHLGGTRNGMVLSWPAGIRAKGELRSQYHFVSDIMPTILEAAQIKAPAMLNGVGQQPINGISMRYSFDDRGAKSHRDTQVFGTIDNVGIYHAGWLAGTTPRGLLSGQTKADTEGWRWELYDIERDFTQNRDLAAANPEKLAELKALFEREAAANRMLPIPKVDQNVLGGERPGYAKGRTQFTYADGVTQIPAAVAPKVLGRSFTISAEIQVPAEGARGVILAHGGRYGGYSFYLKDGRPAFHYNAIGQAQSQIASSTPVPPGSHRIEFAFDIDKASGEARAGNARIMVDGHVVASGRIDRTLPYSISYSEGLDVGRDTTSPVTSDYSVADSRFTGEIKSVTVDVR